MNKENTLTRDQIQELFIKWNIEQCSPDELEQFMFDEMNSDLDLLDDVELVKEVKHYAPHLIEAITLSI